QCGMGEGGAGEPGGVGRHRQGDAHAQQAPGDAGEQRRRHAGEQRAGDDGTGGHQPMKPRALSLMRSGVHGGSQTSSTWISMSGGSARSSWVSMSSMIVSVTGQAAEVIVTFTSMRLSLTTTPYTRPTSTMLRATSGSTTRSSASTRGGSSSGGPE